MAYDNSGDEEFPDTIRDTDNPYENIDFEEYSDEN